MKMLSKVRPMAGAAAILAGGAGALVSTGVAWASAGPAHGITITLDFSSNPSSTLNPVVGPPLTIPGTCPFDAAAVFTVTGNAVEHGVGNKNGDWGGGTVEGAATLAEGDGAPAYAGQVTAWFGGGNNATGQAEEGETFHFHGTSTSDGSSLDVYVSYHGTMNDNGSITSFAESVICK